MFFFFKMGATCIRYYFFTFLIRLFFETLLKYVCVPLIIVGFVLWPIYKIFTNTFFKH